MREALVITSTSNRAIEKAKAVGILNLNVVAYMNMLKKRIDFLATKEMTGCNAENLTKLRNQFLSIMNKCPEVCNYRVTINTLCKTDEELDIHTNNAPTVSGVTTDHSSASYQFKYSDFTNEFNDIDPGDRPKFVEITLLPDVGTIKYLGVNIPQNFVFDLQDVTNLTFELDDPISFTGVNFTFKTSDDNQKPLFSNEATYTFNAGYQLLNMPPTTGDNTITVDKNVITPLTLAMFTTETSAPYNDPENDLIDALRVDRLHNTNIGTFELNGTPVVNGQIITREQLQAEEFVHVGRDEETIHTDGFEFSVRDEGSGIWVQ